MSIFHASFSIMGYLFINIGGGMTISYRRRKMLYILYLDSFHFDHGHG